jgi:hypothetical protein
MPAVANSAQTIVAGARIEVRQPSFVTHHGAVAASASDAPL